MVTLTSSQTTMKNNDKKTDESFSHLFFSVNTIRSKNSPLPVIHTAKGNKNKLLIFLFGFVILPVVPYVLNIVIIFKVVKQLLHF